MSVKTIIVPTTVMMDRSVIKPAIKSNLIATEVTSAIFIAEKTLTGSINAAAAPSVTGKNENVTKKNPNHLTKLTPAELDLITVENENVSIESKVIVSTKKNPQIKPKVGGTFEPMKKNPGDPKIEKKSPQIKSKLITKTLRKKSSLKKSPRNSAVDTTICILSEGNYLIIAPRFRLQK